MKNCSKQSNGRKRNCRGRMHSKLFSEEPAQEENEKYDIIDENNSKNLLTKKLMRTKILRYLHF